MSRFIDLHIHSTYSDGALTPQEIVNEAKKLQTRTISIADHDTFDSLQETKQIAQEEQDLIIVPGIEISSFIENRKLNNILIHILGYGIKEDSEKLNDILKYMKETRTQINTRYIETILSEFPQISEKMLSNVDRSRYCRIAREVVIALANSGISEDLIGDIKRYCRHNLPKYEGYDVDSNLVIDAIISAGGIPILAHPTDYRLRDIELKRMIKKLIDMGLEGMETYYSEATNESMYKLRMMAESYKILHSCGSDFHFFHETDTKIIGHGINDNLCKETCSLEQKIMEKGLYLRKGAK